MAAEGLHELDRGLADLGFGAQLLELDGLEAGQVFEPTRTVVAPITLPPW